MIDFFAKRFIKDDQNYGDARVRTAYGTLCSIAAIAFNVLLFAAKEFIGILTGSVAIMADAFNNLADAGSAVLMLVGFKFANAKPAPDRPFGHGRIEYITGLIVSALILVAAVELGRSSVVKIITPEAITFSWVAVLILALSIAVKFYRAHFTRSIADKIDSSAMRATAADYTSDTLSTFVVL
ncbi:MAG: cation diffusion facilitator family transporter, partial [Clostridiales bacterium]|nr:cation diffusion facilitator family transporter [Clostridiales bacterium]